jgi:glucose 1-dehydrogenase
MGIKQLFDLKGHTALVTGASQGIGSAIALALAEFGANIVIHCRSEIKKAQIIATQARRFGVKADVVVCDLADNEAPVSLFNMTQNIIGDIDILILNASVQIRKKWNEITPEEYNLQMTVNFRNSLFLIQHFSKYMIEKKWGRIITLGSVQQKKPHQSMVVYAASKSAQENMVRNLASQLGTFNITVNNITPGVFKTVRNQNVLENEEFTRSVLAGIPLGFIAQPVDCAGIAVLLASEAGRYITGADIFVDGGMSIR